MPVIISLNKTSGISGGAGLLGGWWSVSQHFSAYAHNLYLNSNFNSARSGVPVLRWTPAQNFSVPDWRQDGRTTPTERSKTDAGCRPNNQRPKTQLRFHSRTGVLT